MAIIFAFIGVVSNIILAGKLSLESVFVCMGYPIYFYLRRKFGLSHLHSFIFEIAFLIPVASSATGESTYLYFYCFTRHY